MIEIREAIDSDAQQCSAVLCASIRDLCIADHQSDEETITKWTSNKSEKNLRNWILDENTRFYVAESNNEIVGVGAINLPDEVALNYVSPTYRFKGTSRAILEVLENALREAGCAKAKLTSTLTAYEFYQASGWKDVKAIQSWPGLSAHVMEKEL